MPAHNPHDILNYIQAPFEAKKVFRSQQSLIMQQTSKTLEACLMKIRVVETNRIDDFTFDEMHSSPLIDTDEVHALLLNIEEGEIVGPCQMSIPVVYYVIQGGGRLTAGGEVNELQAGSLALVPADQVRCLAANDSMRVLAIQIL